MSEVILSKCFQLCDQQIPLCSRVTVESVSGPNIGTWANRAAAPPLSGLGGQTCSFSSLLFNCTTIFWIVISVCFIYILGYLKLYFLYIVFYSWKDIRYTILHCDLSGRFSISHSWCRLKLCLLIFKKKQNKTDEAEAQEVVD